MFQTRPARWRHCGRVVVIHSVLLLTIFKKIISGRWVIFKFWIPLYTAITHYIILQNSSSLRNDHLKNCKRQSTEGVTWLPQRHLPVRIWNIHITHNSFQWHDGTDDKDDFSSSILHPRVRFLIQQRDKYFCAGLMHKVDSVLWIFTKFEAHKLGKTFQQRNSLPSFISFYNFLEVLSQGQNMTISTYFNIFIVL